MTTIASLRVGLEADSTKLKKGLESAKTSITKFGAATLAVGAGFGLMIQRGLDSADALQKMSLRTGIGVTALSVFEHAASQADVSVQSLERGIVNMNRNLQNALRGVALQEEAFNKLGINVQAFAKLRPEIQFAVLADAFNRVKTEAQQAALGQEIFGGAFRRLRPLLKGGSAGLKEAALDAERLGLVMDQQTAEAAARANDQMTRLKNTLGGVGRTLAIELAPGIADFVEALNKKLPTIIASVSNVIGGVQAAFLGVGNVIGGVLAAIGAALSGEFRQSFNILRSIPDSALRAASKNYYWGDDPGTPQPTARQMRNGQSSGAGTVNGVDIMNARQFRENDARFTKEIVTTSKQQLEALEFIRQELVKRQTAVAG